MSAVRQPRPLASEPRVDSPYLKADEAAAYLRYDSVDELYKAIARGAGIPFVRRGSRTMLFHRDQLDRWLAGESRLRLLSEARK